MIKQMHEELALLRYQNVETKNLHSQSVITIQNQRTRHQQEKVEFQLTILKLQKEVALLKDEEKMYRESLQKVESKVQSQTEQLAQL